MARVCTLRILAHLPCTGLRSWCNEANEDPNRVLDPRGELNPFGNSFET